MSNKSVQIIHELLLRAGIEINGNNCYDIQIKDQRFYESLLKSAALALGETYMNAWWECEKLDEFFFRLLRADLENIVLADKRFLYSILRDKLRLFFTQFINLQSKSRAKQVGKRHYDLGNDLFQGMLDKRMNYSCAYWKNSTTLNEAQEAKLELICQKLQLQPGMRVLDIGCGWGGFAKYAAEKYRVNIVGITISAEQKKFAEANCRDLPIEIRLQDYRDLNEPFDRICSIGMFEHVGHKNYRTYLNTTYRCLAEGGLFLLHTIGNNISTLLPNEWITKYIFPNGALPSIQQISRHIEGLFVMEDWHNFGADYDKTLMAWHQHFNQHWETLKSQYDEQFYRMWNFYLLASAGAFRARDIQVWQIVLSKKGISGGYTSIR